MVSADRECSPAVLLNLPIVDQTAAGAVTRAARGVESVILVDALDLLHRFFQRAEIVTVNKGPGVEKFTNVRVAPVNRNCIGCCGLRKFFGQVTG